jgi:membrane-bound serine protease (ClpP class)
MLSELIWPVVLIVLGMIMLFIEAIVPSFGIIGIAAFILIGGGVVSIWTTAGMIWGVVAIGVSVPVFVVALVLFFKSNASKIFVQKERIIGDSSNVPAMTHLIGQRGIAQTPLRPSGIALINHKRIDVVSDGGAFVEKGKPIAVVRIDTNSVIVEEVDDETAA